MEAPEKIPSYCGKCDYFKKKGFFDPGGGFCNFYKKNRSLRSPCIATESKIKKASTAKTETAAENDNTHDKKSNNHFLMGVLVVVASVVTVFITIIFVGPENQQFAIGMGGFVGALILFLNIQRGVRAGIKKSDRGEK